MRRSDRDRQRARIGVDANYSLAKTKPRREQASPRSARDDLIDAPYPRVDLEVAIAAALARLGIVGGTNSPKLPSGN